MIRDPASGSGATPPDLDGGYPRRGSVIADTYRLDALIGEGPSGLVYNAWHLHEHRAYAVKVLHSDLGALTAALVRLRHDNQAIERLRHPHLGAVRAIAAQAHGHDPPVLHRPLLPSESLRARLELGPLPLPDIARLFHALCGALVAAGRVGVVHGDLKPENVLLLPPPGRIGSPVPQVIDFGMCHLRDREGGIGGIDYRRPRAAGPSHGAPPLGREEGGDAIAVAGAAQYLAPEQIQGDGAALDGRADVFALGALLYECLTGRPAFAGATPAATVAQICLGERPRPSALAPGLPPALDELVERACHRLAEERLPSPRALWTALQAAIGEEGEVREALREAAPAAPSGRVALLPVPGPGGLEAGAEGDAAQGGDFAPASTVSLWPRARRPRRPTGAQAIRLFKELEAANLAPGGRGPAAAGRRGPPAEAPEAGGPVLDGDRAASHDSDDGLGHVGAPGLDAMPLRPAAAPGSTGSQVLRRSTAERAALLLDSGRFAAQATPDPVPAAPTFVNDDEITGRLHSAETLQRPAAPPTPPVIPIDRRAEARTREPEHRPDPLRSSSPGLEALLGRRPRTDEPLPPVLGLPAREGEAPALTSAATMQLPDGQAPASAVTQTAAIARPAAEPAPAAPESRWLRPLPALCGAVLLLLVLLLVLLS